jgi:hypothetical protein
MERIPLRPVHLNLARAILAGDAGHLKWAPVCLWTLFEILQNSVLFFFDSGFDRFVLRILEESDSSLMLKPKMASL